MNPIEPTDRPPPHPRLRQPTEDSASGAWQEDRHPRLVPLSLGLRIVLFIVGWTLLLVGVAGLVLPGIQGVLTILAGAAILSLVSELAYKWLRSLLKRWPGVWQRIEGFRLDLHRRLRRRWPGKEAE